MSDGAGGGTTATGRPRQSLPAAVYVMAVLALAVSALELVRAFAGPLTALKAGSAHPWLSRYEWLRGWAVPHPRVALFAAALIVLGLLLLNRWVLLVWHNDIVARISGTRFSPRQAGFPMVPVDVIGEIARRPPGQCFVGMTPVRPLLGFIGRRSKPVYISKTQKTMHRHVLGKTGSGKTEGVIWPGVLQDAMDGKGVVVISGKGSNEEVLMMKAIAALTHRQAQLRVLSLPAWNQPQLFTHSYNMVYVRPRTRLNPGGDPAPMAERVFDCLPMGDNEYYNTQARVCFGNLCKLLHGMVDADGVGLPFVLTDLLVCFRGIGGGGGWERALMHCLATSLDRGAALSVEAQVRSLKVQAQECFSGIVGALERFQAPMVNAYAPDVVFEEVLETNGLVYVQLPANLFKYQAPALGRLVLMDIQQEGSLRQVFRDTRNQTPCAVVVDEFYNFADISIIDSLNKLRDAHLEFTLAHQSIADLELVSKEFAQAVWDNTRTKDVLHQDHPVFCELVAKSIGTHQVIERTVRVQQGQLFTALTTGDASTKLVEAFRLPPNAIKNLAVLGQGYLVNDEGLRPVCYGRLPPMRAEYELPRKEQANARGLRLYQRFVETSAAVAS